MTKFVIAFALSAVTIAAARREGEGRPARKVRGVRGERQKFYGEDDAEFEFPPLRALEALDEEDLVGFQYGNPPSRFQTIREQLGHPASGVAYIPPEIVPAWLSNRMQIAPGKPTFLQVENRGNVPQGSFNSIPGYGIPADSVALAVQSGRYGFGGAPFPGRSMQAAEEAQQQWGPVFAWEGFGFSQPQIFRNLPASDPWTQIPDYEDLVYPSDVSNVGQRGLAPEVRSADVEVAEEVFAQQAGSRKATRKQARAAAKSG